MASWTEAQILAALKRPNGADVVKFRADVLRGGARLRGITIGRGSSITLDRNGDTLRTGRFLLFEPLNWLIDEIKPYMLLRMEDAVTVASIIFETCAQRDAMNLQCAAWDARGYTCEQLDAGRIDTEVRAPQYAEFPLGVFIPSTPVRSSAGGMDAWEVEGYDRTVILKEDSLDAPLFLPAGTEYLDAVQEVLVGAGITNVWVADFVATTLPADREFEIGTSKLEVINTLLAEINFDPVYCDMNGWFVLSAYKEPSPERVDIAYADDEYSIIVRETQSETDFYGVPNVFIGVCSNPDLDEDYRSVYINDNPLSPFSAVRRGRRIVGDIITFDQIASQAELDAAVRRVAFELSQAEERIRYSTALNPKHGRADVIALTHPDASGVFDETGWTLPLEPGALMQHEARRVVLI